MAKTPGKTPNFNKLLEQSMQLNTQTESQYPLIQRNVSQIEQTTKKLVSKTSKGTGDIAKNKAHYLLAGKGFDADKLSRNLNSINLRSTFEPLEPLTETDIEGYLRHEHEMIILTAIEETKKQTISLFEQKFTSAMEDEWENIKKEMFRGQKQWTAKEKEMLHAQQSGYASPIGTPGRDRSLVPFGTPTQGQMQAHYTAKMNRSVMDAKMLKYARVVNALNDHLRKDQPFGLISSFRDTASQIDDRDIKKAEIVDCWELIRCMLHEESVMNGEFQGAFLSKLAYFQKYQSGAKDLKRDFIRGTKQFLEEQCIKWMRNQCASNPLKSMVGSMPTTKNVVRGYLNIKFTKPWPAELELVDGFPLWAQIYYCVRCGDFTAAVDIARSAPESRIEKFGDYLSEYINNNGRLPDRMWLDIRQEYKLYASNSTCDPYKLVVYNIIGKCELTKNFPSVITSTQDFMWYKLSLVRESDEPLSPSIGNYDYPLSKLQKTLVDFGPDHFNKSGRTPLLYFQVLIMSQQFEKAIQYLNSIELYQVETIHFALALYYYGILLQPQNIKSKQDQSQSVFDFVRLLRQYVSSFASTDPVVGLYYYNVIHDIPEFADSTSYPGATMKEISIKDLVLETREFEILFGDGMKAGLIEELLGRQKALKIIELSALDCEANGRYEDAIRLFDLAQNYDKVLSILNSQLGKVMSARNVERDRLIGLASMIIQKHQQFNVLTSVRDKSLQITFEQVLAFVTFFDLYHSGRYIEALQHIEMMNVIPFDAYSVDKKVEAFKMLDHAIKRNFADILLSVMDILYKLYGNLKSSSVNSVPSLPNFNRDGGKEQKIFELRTKARTLVMFAGMIQFRMPGDTIPRLIRMEVFMST